MKVAEATAPVSMLFTLSAIGPLTCSQPITAAKAEAIVRGFSGESTARSAVSPLRDDDAIPPIGRFGRHFRVTIQSGASAGMYVVSALTGRILYFSLNERQRGGMPALGAQQAKELAEAFLMAKWPEFSRRKWQFELGDPNSDEYEFNWTEILNGHGTLAPWEVIVKVDKSSGRVVHYGGLPERSITAPTVPRIALTQAKDKASPWVLLPLKDYPLKDAWLRVSEDRYGVQCLTWHLRQYDDRGAAYGVYLDAISGEVLSTEYPLSSAPPRKNHPNIPANANPQLRMRTANNRALARIGSIVAPRILDGKVWIRVEMLRGLGGLVDVDSTDVRVRANNRSLDRQALHAEKRDYGWWVPVAHVARSLGWKTAWVSAERTIIVETRPSIATSN